MFPPIDVITQVKAKILNINFPGRKTVLKIKNILTTKIWNKKIIVNAQLLSLLLTNGIFQQIFQTSYVYDLIIQ